MYQNTIYGDIVVSIFYGEITLGDLETFSQDLDDLSQAHDEIFLIGLAVNVEKFPTNLAQMLKSVNTLKGATGSVTRFYGIEFNAIMSFLTRILTQMLGMKTNTVEARDLDTLFAIMEKEASAYPRLEASKHHLAQIRADIDSFTEKTKIKA